LSSYYYVTSSTTYAKEKFQSKKKKYEPKTPNSNSFTTNQFFYLNKLRIYNSS